MTAAPSLRIVFFGSPAFAVPTLDALLRSRQQVVGVVSQPDRPRGRGQKVSPTPVAQRATDASIPLLRPAQVKEPSFVEALRGLKADLGVVAAYGRILTREVLETPRLGMINVHASLLPRYRGAAPVHRAIVNGERETGVTIMRVVVPLDAGPIMAQARRAIGPDETSVELEHALALSGASLLVTVVDALAEGTAVETPQNEADATYAHRLTRDDGIIDWTLPATRLHNLVRGLHPWPHAHTTLGGTRFIVLRSAVEDVGAEPAPPGAPAAPGSIVEAAGDDLRVATGEGTLQLLQIQPEGKRPMAAREFLAGHRLRAGDRFGT
jgi:methionyl-tRNA formyltransferase